MKQLIILTFCFVALPVLAQQRTGQFFAVNASFGTPAPVVPTILQRVSFSSISNSVSGQGTNLQANGWLRLNIPSPTQTGNALLMAISARTTSAGTWASIKDDQNNTWTQATYGFDSTGAQGIWWYVATNIAANTHFIWLTNGAPIMSNLVAVVLEVNNVPAYNPVDVTNTFTAASSTTMSAGIITPTRTGDLILEYVARTGTGSTIPTYWTAGSQANITWALTTADVNDGHACQWGIDGATAAINPQMTCSVSATRYSAATIALKAAATTTGSGRPAGLYVAGVLHQAWGQPTMATRTVISQFPTVGNLLVLGTQAGGVLCYPTNTVDSIGTTYTIAPSHPVVVLIGAGGANTCCIYGSNLVANANLYITNTVGETGDMTIMAYDIVGASAYPYDYGVQWVIGDNSAGLLTNKLALPHWFTPAAANEFVLYMSQQVFLTTSNAVSPTGILFDCEIWQNEGRDGPSNADQNNAWAHIVGTDTSPQEVAWVYSDYTTLARRGDMSFSGNGFVPAGASPTASPKYFVQSTNVASASTTSLSVQCAVTNDAGELIIVGGSSATGRTITVTDSHNTYTAAQVPTNDGSSDDAWIYYATNTVAGANTVNVAVGGGASYLHYSVSVYHGFAKYAPFDKVHTANTASSLTFSSGNTATTSFQDELIYGLFVDAGNGLAVTTGAGFSLVETIQPSAQTTEDSFQHNTGAYAATFTVQNSTSGSATVATFH